MNRIGTAELARLLGDWSSGSGSLARQLATALRTLAHTGLIPAGALLPPERQLAQSLAVSRSTLVTALDLLRSEGVVRSRQGSGTIVESSTAPSDLGGEPRVLAQLLRAERGIDLSAAAPWGARHLPPLALDLDDLLAADPAHGYGPRGLRSLRTLLAARAVHAGTPTATEEILVTNGAQQGLHLALRVLASRGSSVVVERPTYPGLLDALADLGLSPVPVDRHDGGIDLDQLRRALPRARVAYVQPIVHNPTGGALDEHTLVRLAEIYDAWGGTVIEDLALADLRHDGPRLRPLAARCRSAGVVSIESLSKLAWAGLRLGWVRAPADVIDRLSHQRHAADLGTSIPSQILAMSLLAELDDLAARRRVALAQAAERTGAQLASALPDWAVPQPQGGCALWVTLPVLDATPLVQLAQRDGVFVAPGSAADPLAQPSPSVRISIDRPEPQLDAAVSRLQSAWARLGV